MRIQTRILYFATVLIVFTCFCTPKASAQHHMVAVTSEEDVIKNSAIQRLNGTNKVLVTGPLVPVGTIKRPIIYSIRAELDGEKAATSLIVTFDGAGKYIIFESVVNAAG